MLGGGSMALVKGDEVSGVVSGVENYGIFLEMDNDRGFLPKEEMFVSKKKKLTDIFSVGYMLKATVLSKKKDYYVLTQKNIGVNNGKDTKEFNEQKIKEGNNKKKSRNKKTELVTQETKKKHNKKEIKKVANNSEVLKANKKQVKQEKQGEKKPTLNDLKKLQSIGGLKISVKKKSKNITIDEKEEKVEKILLDVPENFIENIIADLEKRDKQFSELVTRAKGRGFVDEN